MTSLIAFDFQSWLPPLAIAVVSFWLLRRAYRRPKKATAVHAATRNASDLTHQEVQHAVEAQRPGQFDRWEVRLHDVGREWTAVMDSKIVILRHLLDELDQRIERLESLRSESEVADGHGLEPDAAAPTSPAAAETDPRAIASELLERISEHGSGPFPSSIVESP